MVVKVRTLFDDAMLLVLILLALPVAILVVGAPLALLVRLVIALAQRLL
jgi:hypothetical protein